ncbi:MAG: zinc-ribbon domain-containing protein [Actinomycetia bacterium]|nr:zinc-ribbon domain-containing protein [Actinomycetes bacterium]
MVKDKKSTCKCPYCDTDIELKSSVICTVCDLKISRCPECGYPISENIEKCPNCGVKL